jgi:hypothetical protein
MSKERRFDRYDYALRRGAYIAHRQFGNNGFIFLVRRIIVMGNQSGARRPRELMLMILEGAVLTALAALFEPWRSTRQYRRRRRALSVGGTREAVPVEFEIFVGLCGKKSKDDDDEEGLRRSSNDGGQTGEEVRSTSLPCR